MDHFNPILLGVRPHGPHDCKLCSDYDHYLNHCRFDVAAMFGRREVNAAKPCGRPAENYPTETSRG